MVKMQKKKGVAVVKKKRIRRVRLIKELIYWV